MGVIAVAAVILLILVWFFWPSRTTPTRPASRGERLGVDEAELEAAERDVQEAADEHTVQDWGPGAGQKPLP